MLHRSSLSKSLLVRDDQSYYTTDEVKGSCIIIVIISVTSLYLLPRRGLWKGMALYSSAENWSDAFIWKIIYMGFKINHWKVNLTIGTFPRVHKKDIRKKLNQKKWKEFDSRRLNNITYSYYSNVQYSYYWPDITMNVSDKCLIFDHKTVPSIILASKL